MRNFRGRINGDGGEDFLIEEDSDSEMSESEVEAVFPNMLIINQQDLIGDGDDEDDTSAHTETSDDEEEIIDFVPADDEFGGEDVSMEGYFAFGGRPRTRSIDEVNNAIPPHEEPPPLAINNAAPQARESSSNSNPLPPPPSSPPPPPLPAKEADPEDVPASESSPSIPCTIAKESDKEVPSVSESQDDAEDTANSTANGDDIRKSVDEQIDLMLEPKEKEDGDSKSSPRFHEVKDEIDESKTEVTKNDVEEEEEETCNPMVSDVEELEENEDAFRGDRIGTTTYSQRHVLKLLIKWVQELPKYSASEKEDEEKIGDSEVAVDKSRFLEQDFEEEMALLWDMSFEPDVMSFLVENNVFNMIKETLDLSSCARLSEISLGILANTLSQQSIAEDFCIHDASLKLVEVVVSEAVKMPGVPVLIQVFAVLRRITWFLRSVAPLQKWLDLLLSPEFLTCANFIMSSSTNAILLGSVIVTMFTLLETLSTELEEKDEDDQKKQTSHNYFGKALNEKPKDYEKYRPFCETPFMPSLCEGLKELMKKPKPRKTQQLTSTRDKVPMPSSVCGTEERGLDEDDIPIPDGLVQNAILNGLVAMFYLHKTINGKDTLRQNLPALRDYLVDFFRKFSLYTETSNCSDQLRYFALAVNLITFCHNEASSGAIQDDFIVPVATASKLMDEEGKDDDVRICVKEGEEQDSNTFIALVIHEYLASMGETFGHNQILAFKTTNKKYSKFFEAVDKLVCRMTDEA